MPRPSISVATIIKDEALHLKEYFVSIVPYADEIVIVDTGSSDDTLRIIEEESAKHPGLIKFFHYKPEGIFHYGKAKNFSIDKATKDYVLVLDADEYPKADFLPKLRDFLTAHASDVATLVRIDETVPHLVERHERIIKRESGIRYGTDEESRLHEHLTHAGTAAHFEGVVMHCQGENHWVNRPSRILPQMALEIERTPKTKSFLGHCIRGVWAFQFKFRKTYFSQETRKDGMVGLKFAFMRGLYALLVQVFVGLKPDGSPQGRLS